MIRSQIQELKASIRGEYETKIKKLQDEMQEALESLDKVEKTLLGGRSADISPDTDLEKSQTARYKPVSASSRMMSVIQKLNGDFSRQKVFDMTLGDGIDVPIARGTLAVTFAHFVKNGTIVVKHAGRGTIPGIYCKATECVENQTDPSPVDGGLLL